MAKEEGKTGKLELEETIAGYDEIIAAADDAAYNVGKLKKKE